MSRGYVTRRGFLMSGLGLVAATALAACAPAATESPTAVPATAAPAAASQATAPTAAPTTAPAAAAAPAKVDVKGRTVQYWNDYGGANGKAMDVFLSRFTTETGVKVEQVRAAEGDLISKMRLSSQAGTSPDVVMLLTYALYSTAHDGLIDAMDEKELSQRGFNAADYADTPWKGGMYKGKRYALPLDFVQMVMYLNDPLFKDAGLLGSDGKPKVPASKDELIATAQKLTKAGDTYGLNVGPPGGTWWFQNLLFQNGGNFFNEDMTKSALANPEAIEVADFWGQVFGPLKIAPPGAFDTLKGFIAGKLAMSIDGSWSNPGFTDAKLTFTVARIPKIFKNQKAWGIDHSFTFPVQKTKDDARMETAWTLLRWMTDNAENWTITGGVMAALKKVQASPKVLADPLLKVAADQTPDLQFSQATSRWSSAEDKSTPVLEAIYNGTTPAKDGMQKLSADVDTITE